MTTDQLLKQAKRALASVNDRFGYQGGEEDQAWELLTHVLGAEPDYDDEIPAAAQRRFDRLVQRRVTGEPMAYILGWIDFNGFRLDIKPGMFVPRATSEFMAQQAIRRLRRRRRPLHVDLATGIGPIALSTARAVPHGQAWGLDISRKALNQARANATRMGLKNVNFRQSDLFAALPSGHRGEVDVVTIHPPYVARREVKTLPVEIKDFEPGHTLTDGSVDGLGLVRRTISEGREWIRPGGWLLIEIVPSETRGIRSLLRQAGYTDIRSTHGSMRYTRVIVGRV